MLLKSDKAKRILKYLDLVAVSIDGKEAFHDAIRGQQRAFKKMLEGVEVLKNSISDLYKIYIAHFYLKTHYEKEIFIQLDLLHRDNIIDNPNFVFHQNFKPELNSKGFSSIFKELIINEKGDILPIAHGCTDFFKIGNINSKEKLAEMIERFMEEKFQCIAELYQSTYEEIANNPTFEIFNWSEMLIQKSHEMFPLQNIPQKLVVT